MLNKHKKGKVSEKVKNLGLLGGSMAENPPANAGDGFDP